MTDTTMTLRLSAETKSRLDKLSTVTRRSRSFLANEAVTRYIENEEKIIEGITRAQADLKAGRYVTHEAAMERLEATIGRAAAKTSSL